jgi:hypothetical protein
MFAARAQLVRWARAGDGDAGRQGGQSEDGRGGQDGQGVQGGRPAGSGEAGREL